jgi:acyl-CoA thioesterase FadM
VTQLGNTSIVSDHRISRDGEPIVEGTTRHVLVENEGLTKAPIPDWMRHQLEPWTVPRGS